MNLNLALPSDLEDNDEIFRWAEAPKCFMCLSEQIQRKFSVKDNYNQKSQVGLNLKSCPVLS